MTYLAQPTSFLDPWNCRLMMAETDGREIITESEKDIDEGRICRRMKPADTLSAKRPRESLYRTVKGGSMAGPRRAARPASADR
jgi:hypothetical protein